MPDIFAVIGGDSRMRYLAEYLSAEGACVRTFAAPDLPDTEENLKKTLHLAKYVILPMPVLAADGSIRNGRNLPLLPEQVADFLSPNAVVFGGKFDGAAPVFRAAASKVEDYAGWEPLIIDNIVPTAEGAIGLILQHLPVTIHGSRFLITGAGRIGMCLAMKLQALGGHVTVTARKERDFARIRSLGLDADTTKQYTRGLGQYHCILNTIPARVFTASQLADVHPSCAVIELASQPGGFPQGTVPVISGAALPGRTSPKTAGEIIATHILQYIRTE